MLFLSVYLSATNLLKNPGFEGGKVNWDEASDTVFKIEEARIYNGYFSAELYRYEAGEGGISQIIPVEGSKYYIASGYLYDSKENISGKIAVFFLKSSTDTEPISDFYSDETRTEFSWRYLSTLPILAPKEANFCRVSVLFLQTTSYAPTYPKIYADDISFIELGKTEFTEKNNAICYPNPFNPNLSSVVSIVVPERLKSNELEIKIFNIAGEIIKILNSTSLWDGRDDNGRIVYPGIYFFVIKTEKGTSKGKITVIK